VDQRTRVVVVGDLVSRPNRTDLLQKLASRHAEIQWQWLQAEGDHYNLPHKLFQKLLHDLRSRRDGKPVIIVVKLAHLNGKDAYTLYGAYPDPILPPKEIDSGDELIEWLLSAEARIVPPLSWVLPVRAAGLLAVLAKLIRNKSWNKDCHGHAWTQHDDLVGQAPVNRPEFPQVYGEALTCIDRAVGTLLLTKGGSQGKTKKEWSINTGFLPAVKRAIVEGSFAPLRAEPGLSALMDFVERGPDELIHVDKTVVSEKVIGHCRDRPPTVPPTTP
jgi:hypothetical protein